MQAIWRRQQAGGPWPDSAVYTNGGGRGFPPPKPYYANMGRAGPRYPGDWHGVNGMMNNLGLGRGGWR